jgi:hypothetical protein
MAVGSIATGEMAGYRTDAHRRSAARLRRALSVRSAVQSTSTSPKANGRASPTDALRRRPTMSTLGTRIGPRPTSSAADRMDSAQRSFPARSLPVGTRRRMRFWRRRDACVADRAVQQLGGRRGESREILGGEDGYASASTAQLPPACIHGIHDRNMSAEFPRPVPRAPVHTQGGIPPAAPSRMKIVGTVRPYRSGPRRWIPAPPGTSGASKSSSPTRKLLYSLLPG